MTMLQEEQRENFFFLVKTTCYIALACKTKEVDVYVLKISNSNLFGVYWLKLFKVWNQSINSFFGKIRRRLQLKKEHKKLIQEYLSNANVTVKMSSAELILLEKLHAFFLFFIFTNYKLQIRRKFDNFKLPDHLGSTINISLTTLSSKKTIWQEGKMIQPLGRYYVQC